jgi:hypothetical protein
MPLIEITYRSGKITKEQQLQIADAVQKIFVKELKKIIGRTPRCVVVAREASLMQLYE